MLAIYKKEVKGFLTSMVGYVFLAFLLVVCGIYYTAYQLQGRYPYFSYTLQAIQFVFLIAVPVLTMRILAEERRQKTDQLLLTAPVSVTEIILGKYLALVTVYLIAVIVLCCYPLILTQFGNVALSEAYTALFGFFLLGCSFLAVGLYLSSVTESQVIAAVITFLVLFVSYVSEGIASFFPETASASFYTLIVLALAAAYFLYLMLGNQVIAFGAGAAAIAVLVVLYVTNASVYEGLIQNVIGVFDLSGHSEAFAEGILDLTDAVYYLSVIGVCLFLSVQSVQKRRWS